MPARPTIVWLRHDLRLADNPALRAAVERAGPVVPLFVWAPEEEGNWPPGAASRWWLHYSLQSLSNDLRAAGSRLVIRRGETLRSLREVVDATGADSVVWNRRYEPAVVRRDRTVKQCLQDDGLDVESFNGSLLFEPWEIENKQGRPYQVFTQFWKRCREQPEPAEPLETPRKLKPPREWPDGLDVDALDLLPQIDWAGGLRDEWSPGTDGAAARLDRFLREAVHAYADDRNRPDLEATSKLSPHLHFGEISPRTVWHEAVRRIEDGRFRDATDGGRVFLSEIGWREFAHHLLYHFPHTTDAPLREKFADFPWDDDREALRRWQRGRTGYPIVDAGLRELWHTGWMHNRLRMIVGSFLTKDLRLHWLEGARWFWDTLVDANLANNTLGWQWAAGCGADAAPYFRVFNPMTQGEKFDPAGRYTRQWVPEVANLPDDGLQTPWESGRKLDYPEPIVDHAAARKDALEAFEAVKG